MAMCISYILNLLGKTKKDIGCGDSMQLEEYIYQLTEDPDTKAYIKKEVSVLGSWVLQYSPRVMFFVEEHIGNRILNQLGYKAIFSSNLTYDGICDWIETHQLPVVIAGNFSSVSKVGGHMNCCHGFSKTTMKEFIVNDPFASCLNGYKDASPTSTAGHDVHYSYRFYLIDNAGHMNAILFSKV